MSNRHQFHCGLLMLAIVAGVLGCGDGVPSGPLPFEWPPSQGETYPDLELRNADGDLVRLSSFRGKVILIEPIGMT